MVVKSATKKRLMELGVSEEFAHKLATDRNMTDIKAMSSDEVASTLGESKDSEQFVSTMAIIAEQGSRRRAAKKSKKITIRSKAIDDFDRPEITLRFNALNHELVPHQELVGAANISEEEQFEVESKELAPWQMLQPDDETGEDRLAKELLPKILITDPVVQVIKETEESADNARLAADPEHKPLAAGWIADRVLKVVRRSPSAGQSVAYRLIVEGN
ncbi:MAG: DNA-directed RNA polymerase subunit RpoH/Rpb5 C-terminal domain-containing protein [Candidatus Poseidoniaceae archaeon]|nr:DNA-directed RNA polymerase subunit RpoH/Rpb5 C-terminal domain-containing protein [Candidatus Poseidoniaceae archaeon]MDG1556522.1 DNA-directed RNA polymerase subunit RpoH/Rpb5 C-terminal domain-containing protein [Candidatus Poseidoniaceae archaeon]MDG1558997.1 DNA-directed RNA polymerase subunit RpoH/Rpb5 C-terminal domain-containing protein [Candidatus Poseidoniaceae archaeon]